MPARDDPSERDKRLYWDSEVPQLKQTQLAQHRRLDAGKPIDSPGPPWKILEIPDHTSIRAGNPLPDDPPDQVVRIDPDAHDGPSLARDALPCAFVAVDVDASDRLRVAALLDAKAVDLVEQPQRVRIRARGADSEVARPIVSSLSLCLASGGVSAVVRIHRLLRSATPTSLVPADGPSGGSSRHRYTTRAVNSRVANKAPLTVRSMAAEPA